MDKAEWRSVVGYEGLYEVSDDGRVVSLLGRRGPRYELKAPPSNWGYPRVKLSIPGKGYKYKLVHVLMMEAFVGEKPEGAVTRHLDGNPLNNTLSNLKYGTPKENVEDTIRHGRHKQGTQTHCKRGHVFDEKNTILFPNGRWRKCRTCAKEYDMERARLRRLEKVVATP